MPRRRSHRPPPDGPPSRRRWWHRGGNEPSARSDAAAAYESSEAAEQERLIAEALTDLRDMDVREVMTPRVDVAALSIPVHAEDVAQAVRESGHRCFPVVNGSLDEVVGVLYVNDLFRSRRSGRPGSRGEGGGPARPGDALVAGAVEAVSALDISRRIRHAYVIPESRKILDALVEMRRQRRGFAVVVDEYGGVSGVLTLKDLLEPIVGELHDEFDTGDEPSIVRVDGSRWLIDGRVNVDEVRERLGIDLPEGDYVTLGGYLFDGFGRIPEEGETLTTDGWDLTVQEMDRRRVAQVVARQRPPGEQTDDSGDRDAERVGQPAPNRPVEHPAAADHAVGGVARTGTTPGVTTGNRSADGANGDGPKPRPEPGPARNSAPEVRAGSDPVDAGAPSPSRAARQRG